MARASTAVMLLCWLVATVEVAAYRLPPRHQQLVGEAGREGWETPRNAGLLPNTPFGHEQPRDATLQETRPQWYVEPAEEKHLERDGRVRYQDDSDYFSALLPPTGYEHHASQLLAYYGDYPNPGNWTLLCAWFSGEEGMGTVSLMMSRLEQGSGQWSTPVKVRREEGVSLQNPVWLWDRPSGAIHLIHTMQRGKKQSRATLHAMTSYDGAVTWSKPRQLFNRAGLFVRNPPELAKDGRTWLLPMYHTPKGAGHAPSQWSQMAMSEDGGMTWKKDDSFGKMSKLGSGLVQPTLLRCLNETHHGSPGGLAAFFRDRNKEHIWRSDSQDDGRTWGKPTRLAVPTILPNANKAVQALWLRATTLNTVMVFNNNRGLMEKEPCGGSKAGKMCLDMKMWPLSIGLSKDDGITFPWVRDLEPRFDRFLEYSYPSVVQTADGDIHISYTWSHGRRRVAIRYVRIKEDWIKGAYEWGNTRGVYKPLAMPAWLLNG